MTARAWGWLLALGLVHAALSAGFWWGVARHHKAIRSDAVVAAAPEHVSVWITGDSHPRTAIAPRMLAPDVVNAAVGAQHMVKSYYRTRALVERYDKSVDVLIVPLDAVSLSSWNVEQYAPEVVWGSYVDFLELGRVRGQRWRYAGRWLEAHVVPYMGELRTLEQLRTGRYGFGGGSPNGDFSRFPPATRQRLAASDAAAHQAGDHLVDPTQVWALQQLVAWAEARGIQIVFVRFPVTGAYAAHLGAARAAIDEEIVGRIVDPTRHVLLDHESLFSGRDGLFSDPHHLNLHGRALYTRVLRRELVTRGLIADGAADGPPEGR